MNANEMVMESTTSNLNASTLEYDGKFIHTQCIKKQIRRSRFPSDIFP